MNQASNVPQVSWGFAAAVNLTPAWTRQLDGFRKSKIGYQGGDAAAAERESNSGDSSGDEKKAGAVEHVEV